MTIERHLRLPLIICGIQLLTNFRSRILELIITILIIPKCGLSILLEIIRLSSDFDQEIESLPQTQIFKSQFLENQMS